MGGGHKPTDPPPGWKADPQLKQDRRAAEQRKLEARRKATVRLK